jgi:MFS family permease
LYYKLDIDSRVVGLILAIFMLPLILFALPAGYLADKYGKIRMIIPGLLIIGVFFITFGMSGSSTLLLASAFLSTTGLALAWVSTNGLLTDISSKYRRGGIVGVWNIFEDLGYVIGPVFGGLTAKFFDSIRIPFILLGLIVIASIVPVVLLIAKRRNARLLRK